MSDSKIAFQINNTDNKIIFLSGTFDEFEIHNLAIDNNYCYRDFESFLKENNISEKQFKGKDSEQEAKVLISFDRWTRKLAYKEQKSIVLIDKFNPSIISNFLIKGLFMQELMHVAKNDEKLSMKLIFVVNTKEKSLEEQIMPKILKNAYIIEKN
ncbi:MAG: hypothetical protein U9O98_03660 [Asgard group archaeon]|nr:hypothetical protein [Asgard group archaeon]